MGFEFTTLVVICADCTGSCKFNYHTIMTMMASIPFKDVCFVIEYNNTDTIGIKLRSYKEDTGT